jgi:hypothetical protein
VSDPRLERLATLWHRGLETGLSGPEDAELQSLLSDGALAEAWAEKQGGHEKPAAAPAGDELPGRLRGAYRRRYKPLSYWGLRVGLPVLLVAGWWFLWPRDEDGGELQVQSAPSDEAPFIQQESAEPAPKGSGLGPPPGLDKRHHLWITRTVTVKKK